MMGHEREGAEMTYDRSVWLDLKIGYKYKIFIVLYVDLFVLTQTISLIRLADLSNRCGVRAGSRCLDA